MSPQDEERLADLLGRYDEDALSPGEEEELATELFANPDLLRNAGNDRLVDRLLKVHCRVGLNSQPSVSAEAILERARAPRRSPLGRLFDLLFTRPAVPAIYALAGAFAILWLISMRQFPSSTAPGQPPVSSRWYTKPGTKITVFVPPSGVTWVDSNVAIPPSAQVRIEASGAIHGGAGFGPLAGPDGVSGERPTGSLPLPSAPLLALIGAIGSVQSDPGKNPPNSFFRVGSRFTSEPAQIAGKLYLAVNDDYLWDNEGQFEASIWINGVLKTSVTVPGFAAAWMDTPLVLQQGQILRVEASGEIHIGGSFQEVSNPDGDRWPPTENMAGYPLPTGNRYSLVGVTSAADTGPGRSFRTESVFLLGKTGELEVKNPGRLFLGVNDHWPLDNTGSFAVTLTVVR